MKNHSDYVGNPITLMIEGTKRAFNSSRSLAISLLLAPVALGFVQLITQAFSEAYGAVIDGSSAREASAGFIALGFVLFLASILLQTVLQTALNGLAALTGVLVAEAEDRPFWTALNEVQAKFWRVLGINLMVFLFALPLVSILISLIVANILIGTVDTGYLALSIPLSSVVAIAVLVFIVRLTLRYSLSLYSLFDKSHGVLASMRHSKLLTKGRLIEPFAIRTMGGLVPFLSVLIVATAEGALYTQLKVAKEDKRSLPKPEMINYVPLFVILGLILFAFLLTGLIILAVVADKTS